MASTFLILKPKSNLPPFAAETTDTTFKNYVSIELRDFSIDYSSPFTQGAGQKLSAQTLTFNIFASNNSAGFLAMVAQGLSFDRVTLYLRSSHVFAIYTFGTAFITSITHDGSAGDDDATITVTLVSSQFSHHGSVQQPDGTVKQGFVYGWDTRTNTAWLDAPVDGPGFV